MTTTCLPYYIPKPCLQQPPYNNNHLSTILLKIQIYLPVYSNHITIKTTCLPYYRRDNHTYLPTATTLQKQPPVYHTYGDTTILIFLQQPPYNNNHLFTILPEIQLYLPAYSSHLTIKTTCLPYYQRPTIFTCIQQPPNNNNHLSTILPEIQLYLPAFSNHFTITTTFLSLYRTHNYIYLPTATTLQ